MPFARGLVLEFDCFLIFLTVRYTYLLYDRGLIEGKKQSNDVLCVPQAIATIALLAEVADQHARLILMEYLLPHGTNSLPQLLPKTAELIRSWEQKVEMDASPGSYNWNRRLLIHPQYAKSYGFDTFMALKYLGIEMKIFEQQIGKSEMIAWLRRTCRTDENEMSFPVILWKTMDSKSVDIQIMNNQKCPIIIFASHFFIPISTSVLDIHHVYYARFQTMTTEADEVVMFRYTSDELRPFEFLTTHNGHMVVLPTLYDDFLVYFMSNIDDHGFKDTKEITDLISKMQKADDKKAFIMSPEIYVPLFHGLPTHCINMASVLTRTLPRIDKLFQPDGFGDLGMQGHEPSTLINPRITTHIQHIDRLEINHTPDIADIQLLQPISPDAKDFSIFNKPFLLIVWDKSRSIPFYMARIGMPMKKLKISTMGGEYLSEKLSGKDISGRKNSHHSSKSFISRFKSSMKIS